MSGGVCVDEDNPPPSPPPRPCRAAPRGSPLPEGQVPSAGVSPACPRGRGAGQPRVRGRGPQQHSPLLSPPEAARQEAPGRGRWLRGEDRGWKGACSDCRSAGLDPRVPT
ncbi:uncharacterized protein LOC135409709 [Pseudopipra pipra]|uniref:uncharacterized protein LOC135409709 n=1 Tax=Pseudopipra pipra TaxID=415032 RepID=UPI003138855D